MITAGATVESLCNQLNRSKLLRPHEVQAIYRNWRKAEAKGKPDEITRFAKWLIGQRYLTNYQAQQLLLGHVDHLFLNHYRLLDLVGKGRMAGIFKAAHMLGHIVAIKMMPKSKCQDQMLVARFKRESKMACRLKHANIVRSFHMGSSGGRYYLVMDFLEGETLEETLKRRKKVTVAEACRIVYQSLQGLQHIHEQGMVHRDLKPGNLMLVPPRPLGAADMATHQTVKVLDIGLGRILFDEKVTSDVEQFKLTTEGMMLGTPEYMSPEQGKDAHNVDIRTDIYSLGCVLYHAITGQTPFTDKGMLYQIMKHAKEMPKPMKELERSVPDALQSVLNVMLAKDPAKRFATPAKAAQALQPFLGGPLQGPAELSSLRQAYLKWVESQPLEEVNAVMPSRERWLYSYKGKTQGPVGTADIAKLAAKGVIGPNDRLWLEGDDPKLGIVARSAIDFASLVKPGQPAASSSQIRPVTAAPSIPPAYLEMGYNPDTGQVLDAAKFKVWQKEQQKKKDAELANIPSSREVFVMAKIQLDNWVDQEKNKRLIMAGDSESIRADPEVRKMLHQYAGYGADWSHKLWQRLEFMIENRRKYYYAFER